MTNPKLIQSVLVIVLVATIQSGCSPNNLEDCLRDASKAPTEYGVTMGVASCHQKFPPHKSTPTRGATDVKPNLSSKEEIELILEKSTKCDTLRLEKLANFIVINESRKGEKDFELIASEFKKIDQACRATNQIK